MFAWGVYSGYWIDQRRVCCFALTTWLHCGVLVREFIGDVYDK
jgi:hypothetical protein